MPTCLLLKCGKQAQARKGGITEEDMGMQLAALEYQALDLRKKREDKLVPDHKSFDMLNQGNSG